jgi:hypothetical protein
VDVGVVGDLLAALKALLAAGGEGAAPAATLPVPTALSVVLAALRISGGPAREVLASAAAEDGRALVRVAFSAWGRLAAAGGEEQRAHAHLALAATGALFLERREYEPARVAAFVHRLAAFAAGAPSPGLALGALAMAKAMLARYPAVAAVVEGGGGGGSAGAAAAVGAGGEDCEDPDDPAALARAAWALSALAGHHFHPSVRDFARGMRGGGGARGAEAPAALAAAYDDAGGAFNPPIPPPRAHPLAAGAGAGRARCIRGAPLAAHWAAAAAAEAVAGEGAAALEVGAARDHCRGAWARAGGAAGALLSRARAAFSMAGGGR